MAPDLEVIDVDDFCSALESTNELQELRDKCRFLDLENRRLENRANSTDRLNEELRRKLFEQDHLGNVLAQHLGFSDMRTAIQTVQSDDTWSIEGHAALQEYRTRTLQLESELAKHVIAGKEAQDFIKKVNEQIILSGKHAEELQNDLKRVREDRDAARQEASKQMQEARQWRQELQNTLPEMQRLICELQESKNGSGQTMPLAEKENILPVQHSHQKKSSLNCALCSTDPKTAQNYKVEYECLLEKYGALLDVKNKVSEKYARDLETWKKIKDWLFQEGIVPESEPGKVRLKIKRKKIPVEFFEDSNRETDNKPDMASVDLLEEGRRGVMSPSLNPVYAQRLQDDNTSQKLCSQKSLTEPPSTQESLFFPPPVKEVARITDNAPAEMNQFTQESVTEPSSSIRVDLSPSGIRIVKTPSPKVLVIDSSPERDTRHVSHEDDSDNEIEEVTKSNKTTSPPLYNTVKSKSKTLSDTVTPRPRLPLLKPEIAKQPKTEPPRLQKNYLTETPKGRPIRKTMSSVLVPDSPARPVDIRRHHSSSPPMHRINKGKRKATEMSEDEEDETELSKRRISQRKRHDQSLTKPHKDSFQDYMQYKGRGRYSNAITIGNQTINGEFEIDPEKNGGVKHPYDAVVRDKSERKQMEAGDCECCRDYYTAVGIHPPRLQAPLWRSPGSETSQCESRLCRRRSGANFNSASSSPTIGTTHKQREAHKQEISRHRHDWAPPATPPDFWKIGFPTTQEVSDINRRATDMHARKFKQIKAEVNSNTGRYRKRS